MAKTTTKFTKAELHLRDYALTFPMTEEHFPWGHRAMKVKGKIFAILSNEPKRFALAVKLPVTGKHALTLPFAFPTPYGLGKSGWVTAEFTKNEDVPVEMFECWIEESFQAIAPKKVLAMLLSSDDTPPPAAPKKKKAAVGKKSRAAKKKTSKK